MDSVRRAMFLEVCILIGKNFKHLNNHQNMNILHIPKFRTGMSRHIICKYNVRSKMLSQETPQRDK